MYDPNVAMVLTALGYVSGVDNSADFVASNEDGQISLLWFHVDPQPTEQQISDYANDVTTLPNGQLFSVWLAENGGDEILTRRRQARDIPDETSPVGVRIRALIELFNKRDNYLTNRIVQLQDALVTLQASGGNANSRLDGLPTSYLTTSTRLKSDAIQDYKDDIAAGNQDT